VFVVGAAVADTSKGTAAAPLILNAMAAVLRELGHVIVIVAPIDNADAFSQYAMSALLPPEFATVILVYVFAPPLSTQLLATTEVVLWLTATTTIRSPAVTAVASVSTSVVAAALVWLRAISTGVPIAI
jgi:hypothetical protein